MNKKIILYLVTGIIFIGLLATSIYFYKQYKNTKKMLDNPKSIAKEEKAVLLKKIGSLIDLPANEDPTIATVTDKKKLSTNPFFAKTENGDRALFYTKAKKAFLYRPSTNKIIEVSQINVESVITPTTIKVSSSTSIPTSKPTEEIITKLAIYNGTKIKGLAAQKGDFITEKASNFEVIDVDNTVGDYNINMIINLKKVSNSVIQQLNKIIPAKVVALPKGETAPADVDLLLIIGKE